MPTNALALPMPCDILDGCTLRNPCQSRTSQDSSNEPQPSTSHWDNQLCFVTNEFFEEYRKDADLKYDFYIEEYTIQSEVYMESEPFDNQKGGSLKWRLRIYPRLPMDDGHEYIGVFLRLEECQHKRVMASFRFSWVYNLDDTDEVIQYVETPCAQLFYKNKTLGYAKFLDRNVVMETLRALNQQPYDDEDYDEFDGEFGNLHLVCEIKVESQSEELDLRTMGRYVYGCKDKSTPYKQPLLYIM